jgi:hypothetical protein
MKNLNARPAMPELVSSDSLINRFRRGEWLSSLEYSLVLEIPINELDHRRGAGQISPLIETRLRSPRQWEYRLIV